MSKEPSYRTNKLVDVQPSDAAYASGWRQVGGDPEERPGGGRRQLEQVLDLLYRRKWIIVLTFVVMLGVSALYSSLQKPFYAAQSYIMVDLEGEKSRSMPEGLGAPDDNSFFAQNDRSLNDELFVLENSNHIVRRVAERLRGDTVWSSEGIHLPILYAGDGDQVSLATLSSRLRRRVDFQQVRGSNNLVQVQTISAEPGEAAVLANVYAQEYVELTEEARTARLTRSREFLQEQLEKRTADLRQAEEEMEAYLRNNVSEGAREEAGSLIAQIADMKARVGEARIDLRLQRSVIASIEADIARMDSQMVDNITMGLDNKIEETQAQIAQLKVAKQQIEERYPDPNQRADVTKNELARIEKEIVERQNDLRDFAKQFVAAGAAGSGTSSADLRRQLVQLRTEEEQLKARIDLYEDRLAEAEAKLRSVPQYSVELARLERQRVSAERMVQLVSEQLLSTRVAGEAERATGYVRVVREAGMGIPMGKETGRNLLMGGLLGLLLGIALAILSDKLDNRIFKPDQLRDYGYDEIGVIPNMGSFLKKEHDGKAFVESGGRKVSTDLVAYHDPRSIVSEAYRFVRANIQFRFFDDSMSTLLVTSPNVGEGKSVTAANLAMFFARSGRRTILLDADLRRPRVHSLLGVKTDAGLIDVLRGNAAIDQVEQRVSDLTVITAGGVAPLQPNGNGAVLNEELGADELLGSEGMHELLAELRNRYDIVVIDSPPVLAVPDALLLGRACDATIMVTRAGSTKEGDLLSAVGALTKAGAVVLGVLLNGFDISMAYGYKYKYQTHSYYAAAP